MYGVYSDASTGSETELFNRPIFYGSSHVMTDKYAIDMAKMIHPRNVPDTLP